MIKLIRNLPSVARILRMAGSGTLAFRSGAYRIPESALRIRVQKLCCRQKAPPFFPTGALLPSQHKFYQHIKPEMFSTTFLPLALLDSNDHPFAVDIGNLQSDSLGDA